MSYYPKVRGTTESEFQIDVVNSGPQIKNQSGTMGVRNGTDSTYANLSANTLASDVTTPVCRLGLVAGSGAGSAGSTGTLRVADGFTLTGRDAGDTADTNILTWSALAVALVSGNAAGAAAAGGLSITAGRSATGTAGAITITGGGFANA